MIRDSRLFIKIQHIKSLKYFMLAFLFIPPEMIDIIPRYSFMDKVITILSLLIGIVSIMYYLKNDRKTVSSVRFLLAMLGLLVWLAFVNLVAGDSMALVRNIITMTRVSGYCSIILASYLFDEDDCFICGTFFYSLTVIVFNLYSQLHYGTHGLFYNRYLAGWQPIYVCGNANRFALFFIFTMGISMCYIVRNRKSQMVIVPILAILLFSSFISLSDMAKIITILMILGIVFSDSFILILVERYRKVILFIAAAAAFWMIGLAGWKNQFVIDLVEHITDTRSFVIRGSLWNSTINYALKSPLVGYGTGAYRIARNLHGEYQSAHNTYLQIMTFGGLPALALFMIITIIPFKIRRVAARTLYYIYVCVFLFLLVYLFEQNPFYPGYYAMLALLVGETIYHPSEQ